MVIEGGENGLTRIGVNETLDTIKKKVKKATGKVKKNVVVMNIPMRRGKKKSIFGNMRRTVNRKCIENLKEWKCNGIQLSEKVDWEQVWGRDGVHLRPSGQLWVAMMVEDWMNTRTKEDTTRNGEEEKNKA